MLGRKLGSVGVERGKRVARVNMTKVYISANVKLSKKNKINKKFGFVYCCFVVRPKNKWLPIRS